MNKTLSIGLMSGTSMDGIDATLVRTDGKHFIEAVEHLYHPYDPLFQILLKAAAFGAAQCRGDETKLAAGYSRYLSDYLETVSKHATKTVLPLLVNYLYADKRENIAFQDIVTHSTEQHCAIVSQLLSRTNNKVDIIGYHGQTLYHDPQNTLSWQMGNPTLLANTCNIPVVSQFRENDLQHGGQGAPLTPLYHQALCIQQRRIPFVVVNCGGISNVTVITGDTERDVIAFDAGPGNTLIDRYIYQKTQGKATCDENGNYASKGNVDDALLTLLWEKTAILNNNNYYQSPLPKSLDSHHLVLIPELEKVELHDGCATLVAFTADVIVKSVEQFISTIPKDWVLLGGGAKNPEIVKALQARLGSRILHDAASIAWEADFNEAEAFAYLALRSRQGLPITLPGTTGVSKPLTGGKIYFPSD